MLPGMIVNRGPNECFSRGDAKTLRLRLFGECFVPRPASDQMRHQSFHSLISRLQGAKIIGIDADRLVAWVVV